MRILPTAAVLVVTLLAACSTVGEQVSGHISSFRFSEARQVLEEAGAGAVPKPGLSEEMLAARQAFQSAVEERAKREVAGLLIEGKARESLTQAKARMDTCPWSDKLVALEAECAARVQQIVEAEAYWSQQLGVARPEAAACRNFLEEEGKRPRWFLDSNVLVTLREFAVKGLREAAVARVADARGKLGREARAEHDRDLSLIRVSKQEVAALNAVLDIIAEIPDDTGDGVKVLEPQDLEILEKVRSERSRRPELGAASVRGGHHSDSSAGGSLRENAAIAEVELGQNLENAAVESVKQSDNLPIASPASGVGVTGTGPGRTSLDWRACAQHCWRDVEGWATQRIKRALLHPAVTYQDIAEAEHWVAFPEIRDKLSGHLGMAHLAQAGRLSRHSLAASLALVHAARAVELGVPAEDPVLTEVRSVAHATRSSTPRPLIQLNIECEPGVDPQEEVLVAGALRSGLSASSNALSQMVSYAARGKLSDVTIRLLETEMVVDFSDVKSISSTYLSHFQRAPNPDKDSRRMDCDFAEIWVSRAKSRYNSAVTSHNIYPTRWSLDDTNMAYNDYVRAVNDYNAKVSRFNNTPSTIEEPVYMAYEFRQGNVKFGWRVKARVSAAGMGDWVGQEASVASDFLRKGCRVEDGNSSYRREDPLSIDVSLDASLGHLFKVADSICRQLRPQLAKLTFETTADMAVEQKAILSWIYSPLGVDVDAARGLDVPAWAVRCANPAELGGPINQPIPPQVPVSACNGSVIGPLSVEAAAGALAQFVCQTRSGKADKLNTGTGTLIGEGLVLTCAHVLTSPDLRLSFAEGAWRGDYPAEVLFVNSERDVALVRAVGLVNDKWANLRLGSGVAAGEQLVAIGNSAMGSGGTNRGGVVAGIVSNPMIERNGGRYMAADISVASGSSGGPLFSLKDGCLVGVVQLIATSPGLGKENSDVSSSGFLVLAAPSRLLTEWLGLLEAPKK